MDSPAPLPLPRLWLNHMVDLDALSALEFGRVDDGQPLENWQRVCDQAAYLHAGRAPDAPVVGFGIQRFSSFDPDEPENAALSRPPLFDAPQLGLTGASAMEIAIATRALYGETPSLNRLYFNSAVEASGEQALELWLRCLQTGDQMAHFALGYTLFELERYPEAYRHLRYYCEIAPGGSWNWCWFGRAAAAIGETGEARAAFEHAIELEREGDAETDALEQLQRLG